MKAHKLSNQDTFSTLLFSGLNNTEGKRKRGRTVARRGNGVGREEGRNFELNRFRDKEGVEGRRIREA